MTRASFWTLIQQDVLQYIKFSSDFSGGNVSKLKQVSSFFTPSMLCCFLYRSAHLFFEWRLPVVARIVTGINYIVHKADISPASEIGGGLYIPHTVGIVFYGCAGEALTLYAVASVASSGVHPKKAVLHSGFPRLGNHVTVGAYAMVLGDIDVGDNCTVGPNCLLNESIPANTTLVSRQRIDVLDGTGAS